MHKHHDAHRQLILIHLAQTLVELHLCGRATLAPGHRSLTLGPSQAAAYFARYLIWHTDNLYSST